MNNEPDFTLGSELFEDGVPIYINRAEEEDYRHFHSHEYIEIAYVAAGSGTHIIGERSLPAKKGDLFILNYDIPHEFRSPKNDEQNRLVVYNCAFRPIFLDSSLTSSRSFSDLSHLFFLGSLFDETERLVDAGVSLSGAAAEEVQELFERLQSEYEAKAFGYVHVLRSCLMELIIKVFRFYREQNPQREQSERHIFDGTIEYMREHLGDQIRLSDLAATAFYSKSYFCKRFKECTGMTVVAYIQRLRIEEACRLLRESELSASAVADAVGYSDMKYWGEIFKKNVGKTPAEYRKSSIEKNA